MTDSKQNYRDANCMSYILCSFICERLQNLTEICHSVVCLNRITYFQEHRLSVSSTSTSLSTLKKNQEMISMHFTFCHREICSPQVVCRGSCLIFGLLFPLPFQYTREQASQSSKCILEDQGYPETLNLYIIWNHLNMIRLRSAQFFFKELSEN